MKEIKFEFETEYVDTTFEQLISCIVEAKAIFDKRYGADRDGRRGSLELVDLDLKVKLGTPLNDSLDRFDSFPLLQKAIYKHCKELAKEKAFDLRNF